METIYKKKRLASEVLIEYYAYCDLRRIIREDWESEDDKFKATCARLYNEYEELHREESERKERSKSGKVEKKIEALKRAKSDYSETLSETILLKKIKNEKRS